MFSSFKDISSPLSGNYTIDNTTDKTVPNRYCGNIFGFLTFKLKGSSPSPLKKKKQNSSHTHEKTHLPSSIDTLIHRIFVIERSTILFIVFRKYFIAMPVLTIEYFITSPVL